MKKSKIQLFSSFLLRKLFLEKLKFQEFKKGFLENIEGVELLRALENGLSIGTFEIKTSTFSINTRKDFKKAKKILSTDKILKKYINKIII